MCRIDQLKTHRDTNNDLAHIPYLDIDLFPELMMSLLPLRRLRLIGLGDNVGMPLDRPSANKPPHWARRHTHLNGFHDVGVLPRLHLRDLFGRLNGAPIDGCLLTKLVLTGGGGACPAQRKSS